MNHLKLSFPKKSTFLIFLTLFQTLCIFGQTGSKNVLMTALAEEQKREFEILKKNGNPAPYYLSFNATEVDSAAITGLFGALAASDAGRARILDVAVRVGNYKLDNSNGRGGITQSTRLPVDDDPDSIKSAIWQTTDSAYKNAVDTYLLLKTQKATSVDDEYPANNFSPTEGLTASATALTFSINKADWENRVRKLSAIFLNYPEIFSGTVSLTADSVNKFMVSSDGTQLQHGKVIVRISILGMTKSPDGMDLSRFEAFEATSVEGLPNDLKLQQTVEKVAKDLVALRKAPMVEPYTGPAILSGRASGVFFHEIFGHRIEGHRQKDNFEGNTFTARVNQPVLPGFISVIDDPTTAKFGTTDLNGYYLYDDEGVKAQKVPLVENGILKNFLMSRSPIIGFPQSNGHGRSSPGYSPVGRQGNLFVEASKTVTRAQLRQMLLAEVKKQGKKYGLFFDDISGGFTNTSRYSTQAFQVTPIMVYRVFADGHPDELVRGVDLIGTPLTSFSKIIAADDKPEVFNGYCGAESGFIPVSAISPSILISQIEVQKRAKDTDILPILPAPTVIKQLN